MRNRVMLGVLAGVACCGPRSAPQRPFIPPTSLDHADPLAAPRALVIETKVDRDADAYRCGDTVLGDQATSAGKPITYMVPCWDREEEVVERERTQQDRRLGEDNREQLAATAPTVRRPVAVSEIAACKRIPPRERDVSPFAHRKEIADVVPHSEGGQIHGARIIFKPVPGLTAQWMREAIACHRARFAMIGPSANDLSADPTLVDRAIVTVAEHDHHVEVLVESDDHDAGLLAFDRAQDLMRTQSARL